MTKKKVTAKKPSSKVEAPAVEQEVTQPTSEAKIPRRRVRVGADGRNILNVKVPAGYVGRWVNDDDNRIEEFKARGYEVYNGKDLSSEDGLVGGSDGIGSALNKHMGKGTQGVFMVQRQDWYDEDQSDKQKHLDDVERTIMTNNEEGRYGKIKIEN